MKYILIKYAHQPKIDYQTGSIRNIAGTRLHTKSGVDGSGNLATITFQIKKIKNIHQSAILLSNLKFADSEGTLLAYLSQSQPMRLESIIIPKKTHLAQNYPNPFNPDTWIPYQLAFDGEVTITIYNQKGQVVRELHLGTKPAGMYFTKEIAAYWDGRNNHDEKVASGVYFYTLQAGDVKVTTRKMTIVK
ncbi:MAG: hypothetical protein H8D67_09115 [Deltaproteobacteria bacterium]|nr:hypothetical protein [Deltaproteobacteria bacterium]